MHDGRKVVADALDAANAYIKYVKKAMADQAEQAKQDGARAEMLLMSLVIASLLIAAVAATWIALNISRALAQRGRPCRRSRDRRSQPEDRRPPATTRSAISSSR